MIEAIVLCQRKGRNDPQNLERVQSVLARRLYDGGDGGVVFRAGFRAKASSDLEFGLGRPQGFLAVVVRRKNGGVREEGEEVAPVFGEAFFELAQFGITAILFRVDRRLRQQFIQSRIHLLPKSRPDISLIPLVHGVSQEIQHVQTPSVIREGPRRVSEVQQVRLDILFQSRIDALFHTTKVRKRFDAHKSNRLSISALKVISRLSVEVKIPVRGGQDEKFLGASAGLTKNYKRIIFSGPKHDFAS